ncbi:MAG TPA: hypothetical protein PK156_19235, partial [Polyangium sp.]|nr:hypothetical protein [Polyangium sp.]
MSVLDLERIVTEVRARWETMLPRKDAEAGLNSWDPPSFVPNLGIVTRLSVMHSETYKSSTAEVLVVPFARLGEASVALDEFNEKLNALTTDGIVRLFDKPLAEWCPAYGISLAEYKEGMFDHDDAASERRQRALDWANERFPAVAARMKDVYGLILPNYMATFAAFWRSLDDFEKLGAE